MYMCGNSTTSFLHLVAPYNVVIMGDNTYDNGDQLELNCTSEGGPDLEYSWSRTNTFSVTTTTNTSTLTISDLATVDGGEYTCTVTNDAGISMNTITVNGEFKLMCESAKHLSILLSSYYL